MLAQSLLAARTISVCLRSTSCGERTRMPRMWNLSVLHAELAVSLPEGKCSLMFCPPHKIHPRIAPFIIPVEGVWGRAPMFTHRP